MSITLKIPYVNADAGRDHTESGSHNLFGENVEHVSPLELELSGQHTLQHTQDLTAHPLLCRLLADNCSRHFIFSASNHMSTIVSFGAKRFHPKMNSEHLTSTQSTPVNGKVIHFITYRQWAVSLWKPCEGNLQ
jgi:hypothetical protein